MGQLENGTAWKWDKIITLFQEIKSKASSAARSERESGASEWLSAYVLITGLSKPPCPPPDLPVTISPWGDIPPTPTLKPSTLFTNMGATAHPLPGNLLQLTSFGAHTHDSRLVTYPIPTITTKLLNPFTISIYFYMAPRIFDISII